MQEAVVFHLEAPGSSPGSFLTRTGPYFCVGANGTALLILFVPLLGLKRRALHAKQALYH